MLESFVYLTRMVQIRLQYVGTALLLAFVATEAATSMFYADKDGESTSTAELVKVMHERKLRASIQNRQVCFDPALSMRRNVPLIPY